jgi:SWI/SNF-related matrix-associated actin-dependent regulator 1 of chromatin subfamily A
VEHWVQDGVEGEQMKIHALSSDTYVLDHSTYSPAMFEAARAIPGCTKNDSKSISGSADAIKAAVDWLTQVKGLNPAAFEGRTSIPLPIWAENETWCDARLRAYQRTAVSFLRQQKRCILADDMGLGKTASAINAAMSFAVQKRVLIVCPSYVRGVWHNAHDGGELVKWGATPPGGSSPPLWPEVLECKGLKTVDAPIDPDAPFVICHYDILHAWASVLQEWNPEIVIFDECHYLMNPETRRTVAAKVVSSGAQYVWGLSGTPMTNRPRDLWGILDTIVPGRFGHAFFPFGLRYCGGYKEAVTPEKTVWKFDSRSNLDELRARLQHIMLRRTKTDVALELPPKTRQVIRVDVSNKLNGASFCEDTRGGAMRAALAVAADAKLKDSAVPLIQSHLDAGKRVVAFTYRRAVAEYLNKECGGSLIHGRISRAAREKTLHTVRGLETSLVSATIDAAGTGIDLSYADVAVFVELTYEPHELLQAEARLHRFGARNPVLIQYLIARGTTDELVADVVLSKLDALESAIGGFTETGMGQDLKEDADSIMADLYARLGL